MPKKKSFLLRVDPQLHAALQKWAEDEFRSLNGQLEFLLRRCLKEAGRLPKAKPESSSQAPEEEETP